MMVQELWPSPVEYAPKVGLPSLRDVTESNFAAPTVESLIVTPQPSGELILGASAANSLRDDLEGQDMIRRIGRQALKVAPGLAEAPIRYAWSGLRPMSPDGLPIAGSLDVEGLYINSGHGFHGMLFGPITARLIAQSIPNQSAKALQCPICRHFHRSDSRLPLKHVVGPGRRVPYSFEQTVR